MTKGAVTTAVAVALWAMTIAYAILTGTSAVPVAWGFVVAALAAGAATVTVARLGMDGESERMVGAFRAGSSARRSGEDTANARSFSAGVHAGRGWGREPGEGDGEEEEGK